MNSPGAEIQENIKVKPKQANTRRNKAKIRVGVSFTDQRQLRSCYILKTVVVAGEQTHLGEG